MDKIWRLSGSKLPYLWCVHCSTLSRERLLSTSGGWGRANGEDLEVMLEAVKVSTSSVWNPLRGWCLREEAGGERSRRSRGYAGVSKNKNLWRVQILSRERLMSTSGGWGRAMEKIWRLCWSEGESISTCGVCNPLQGEADVDEWGLGDCDGEDLEIVLEAIKISTCGLCNHLQGEFWCLGVEAAGEQWRRSGGCAGVRGRGLPSHPPGTGKSHHHARSRW